MTVEDLVDPAPSGVAPDRLEGQPPRDREQPLVGDRAAFPDVGRREVGEPRPARLVERVEVSAAVVALGRPRAAGEHARDVLARQLVPVDNVRDVVQERPVGTARVRRRRPRETPRGVVEAGPDRDEPVVDRGLVGPVVAIGRPEVDRPERGQRLTPEVGATTSRNGRHRWVGGSGSDRRSRASGIARSTLASS